MRVGSLFSGIGGFELGFERAGFDTAFQVEMNGHCNSVLSHHWPDTPRFTDVCEVGHDLLPPVDVIVGGFPCQDISVAGRRAGLAGDRSGLWWEFHRVIYETAPQWVVIENVAGLLSVNRGRDLGAILWALGELGYGFAYRVLDAQGFGVPQRRRRVFIVGCLGDDRRAAEVLLEPESGGGDLAPRGEEGEGVAGTLGGGSGSRGWACDTDRMTFVPTVARCLTSRNERIDAESETFIPVAYQCQGTNVSEMGTIRSGNGHVTGGVPFMAYNPYRTLEKDGSITSGFAARPVVDAPHGPTGNKEPLVADTMAVRRLTPRECERLQGFPDDWTLVSNARGKPMADGPRYGMLGNAVAVACH